MEITCQASYPLNSENASPPGTFKVYLSWAAMALLPKALTSAVTIAIVRMRLFVTVPPLSRLAALIARPSIVRTCGRIDWLKVAGMTSYLTVGEQAWHSDSGSAEHQEGIC